MFPVKHNHSNTEEPAEYAGTMSEDGNINGDLHKTDARQNGDSDYEVRVKRVPATAPPNSMSSSDEDTLEPVPPDGQEGGGDDACAATTS
ncbi:hypothetical protein PG996_012408 [Apiospora saccharicola]|uniref:Uncharacterized protein n=1 Tax=Apiospora saccharicola TaxID=335842 RepID=A0ABR1U323_9PEZI